MKQVGSPAAITRANAWGRDSTATHTRFEIEEQDVGRVLDNYLGHGRPGVQIAENDVGRMIIRMTDGSGWNCWHWECQKS